MLPLLLAAALPALGGIAGHLLSQGDKDKEMQLKKDALARISGVALPTIEEQRIQLQDLVSQGQLSPEALETFDQQNSELSNISTDPRLKDAQMSALSRITQRGNEGFSASDRADLNSARRTVESDVNARNQSVLQNMAQRGMGGSGAELAMQLSNSQAGADRAAGESDRIAAMAQKNALEAAMASGQLGGQIRSQDYNEKSQAAQAQDAINRFNTSNRQGVAQYNVGGRNNAQQYNLGEAQRIADANAGKRDKEEIHNAGLYQQDFENRYRKAGGESSGMNNLAGQYGQDAKDTAQMWAGVGNAAGQGLLAGAGAMGKTKAPVNYEAEMAKGHGAPGYAYGGIVGYSEGGIAKPKAPSSKNDIDELDPKKAREFQKGATDPGWSGLKEGWENAKKELGFHDGGNIDSPKLFSLLKSGSEVPGHAEVPGDSVRNDKVKALLSPGELVIPVSIVNSSNEAILDFIKHVKKKKN